MKFILGKKVEMTQLFADDGKVTPVTVVKAGPCQVVQVKTALKDGYQAVQIGFDFKKKINKPLTGHLKSLPNFRYLKEFRLAEEQALTRGQEIKVNVFQAGDQIKVTGVSKGRGFQGVVKRHGFHGSPASHGHKDQLRMPGSIGATEPARVFKGKRMPGRMGTDQVTVSNLEVIKVDVDKDLLYIKGAVPGARNGLILVSGPGELKVVDVAEDSVKADKESTKQAPDKAKEEKKEDVSTEASLKVEEKVEDKKETQAKETEKPKDESKSKTQEAPKIEEK